MIHKIRSCFIYKLCDRVWAGGYPDVAAIQRLTAEGVKSYINLTRRDEQWVYGIKSYESLLPAGANQLRFPLWTYWLPRVTRLLEIAQAVQGNAPSYVHCRQGLDRTGMIAALVLLSRGMTLDDTLSYLRNARGTDSPRIPYHLKYLRKHASDVINSFGPGRLP
ncbi:MAG: dual specificity protein phosphatase family protein [Desulfomonile tiedjei]|nr:dual specificity protein phosphatase family protein [Desulfomonile tiedjei]